MDCKGCEWVDVCKTVKPKPGEMITSNQLDVTTLVAAGAEIVGVGNDKEGNVFFVLSVIDARTRRQFENGTLRVDIASMRDAIDEVAFSLSQLMLAGYDTPGAFSELKKFIKAIDQL